MQTFVPSKDSRWLPQGHKRFSAIRPTFSLFWGPKRGQPLSTQRLSHLVVEAITHAYKSSGCPLPSGVRSWALECYIVTYIKHLS